MKDVKDKIRKIVAGRAIIQPMRAARNRPGEMWVSMYVYQKRADKIVTQILGDLKSADIPAQSGHYSNQISFFCQI